MLIPRTAKSLSRDLRIVARDCACRPSAAIQRGTRARCQQRRVTTPPSVPARFQPFSTDSLRREVPRSPSVSASASSPSSPKQYTFSEIAALTTSADGKHILIDVREPGELQSTGRIPTAQNAPLASSPDFAFLPAAEFEDRFGFARPGPDDEVIFYCKSGVRSKAAAKLAQQAGFGGVVAEYPGSWTDWEANGGGKETS